MTKEQKTNYLAPVGTTRGATRKPSKRLAESIKIP